MNYKTPKKEKKLKKLRKDVGLISYTRYLKMIFSFYFLTPKNIKLNIKKKGAKL